jgi:hypothetical protein
MGSQPVGVGGAWGAFQSRRTELEAHARIWADKLVAVGEMSEILARFCQDKLKYRF